MEHLAVFETDKGHFAVRPMEWAGIWNADGKIQECGLRHTAIFATKEDAEWYANMKNSDEQGLLLRLPCKVGDTVYYISEGFIEPCTVEVIFLADYIDKDGNKSYMAEIHFDREDCPYVSTEIYFTDIGKTVFLAQDEAEEALKKLNESEVNS